MKVAGFGFREDAGPASLADALRRATEGERVDVLATVADKAQSPTFRRFAKMLDLPVLSVPRVEMEDQITQTQSVASLAARAIGSVAEASALAGAGTGAQLAGRRTISVDRMATCAIAIGPEAGETPE